VVVADGALDLGIDLDVWPWVWLGTAVLFALVELTFIGGTFVLLPFAASAFVAAVLAFYDVRIEIQWAVFVGGGLVLFLVLYRWVRRFLARSSLPIGVGADRLIGTIGIVTVAVEPGDVARRGRISVEGEVWGALSRDEQFIATGTQVRVTAVVGTRVLVEPLRGVDRGSAIDIEEAP
jgi:membrane protein implicated in regulation of membrane protease activity